MVYLPIILSLCFLPLTYISPIILHHARINQLKSLDVDFRPDYLQLQEWALIDYVSIILRIIGGLKNQDINNRLTFPTTKVVSA